MENNVDEEKSGASSSENLNLAPWSRFSDWIHCICIVTFDLELGQAIEVIYPGHAKLTGTEKSNICYLAFPDSNSGYVGDTQYHFRTRCFSRPKLRESQLKYVKNCAPFLQIDMAHYFGFVYFRQTKDSSLPRGYFQKSVVLLTHFPFTSLFRRVTRTVALDFFNTAHEATLEAACHDVDQWPCPMAGMVYRVSLLSSKLQFTLPTSMEGDKTTSASSSSSSPPLPLSNVHLYRDLASAALGHVQLLWELVLLEKPLLVISQTPATCSRVVQSLIGLIRPLRYCKDYRPFFTIHDSEFKEYTTTAGQPPNIILGVTNPFFTKTLHHWPHILRFSDYRPPVAVSSSSAGAGEHSSTSPGTVVAKSEKKLKQKCQVNVKTLDSKPALYSRYKPFLKKDKKFLKKLLKVSPLVKNQDEMLKNYFFDLTQHLMIPLERYMASLMPLHKQISPVKSPPRCKPFDFEEFAQSLEVTGPDVTSGIKGDWLGLYREFAATEAFASWLGERQHQVERKLQLLHLDVLCKADFSVFELDDKSDVEIVDLMLKLNDSLQFVEESHSSSSFDSGLRSRLRRQIRYVFDHLSEDLRPAILQNRQLTLLASVVNE